MTDTADQAAECFSQGFNCAQTVFSAFAPLSAWTRGLLCASPRPSDLLAEKEAE